MLLLARASESRSAAVCGSGCLAPAAAALLLLSCRRVGLALFVVRSGRKGVRIVQEEGTDRVPFPALDHFGVTLLGL